MDTLPKLLFICASIHRLLLDFQPKASVCFVCFIVIWIIIKLPRSRGSTPQNIGNYINTNWIHYKLIWSNKTKGKQTHVHIIGIYMYSIQFVSFISGLMLMWKVCPYYDVIKGGIFYIEPLSCFHAGNSIRSSHFLCLDDSEITVKASEISYSGRW